MNIRITTFSVLFAATCAIAFNTAARADDEEARVKPGSLRFDFGSNKYALDHVESRHHYMSTSPGPGSVHSGAAPKNLLGLDPGFLAKPAPLPVAAPAPVAQQTVAAKPILANNSPFNTLFKNPTALTAPIANAGQFGKPATSAPPIVAHLPQPRTNTGVNGKLLTHFAHHAPTGASARPTTPIAMYNSGYIPGAALPGYGTSGGNSVTSNVVGSVIRKH